MTMILRGLLLTAILVSVPLASAFAQQNPSAHSDWTGFYAKLGMPIGFPTLDTTVEDNKAGPGVGVLAAGGYKFTRGFSAELEVNYIEKSNINDFSEDLSILSITANARVLTGGGFMGGFSDGIQLFVTGKFGGGELKAGNLYESDTVNLGADVGIEFIPRGNIGLFASLGYLLTIPLSDDEFDLITPIGEFQLIFGASYLFR